MPESKRPVPPDEFTNLAAESGIGFEPGELERLGRFLALLLDANTRFNLTGIRDADEAWVKHVYDSLTLMPYIVAAEAKRVIDIGSGGGLPAIPLAIALPEVEVTVLEATGKKAAFVVETAETLGLTNIVVVNDRAETAGQDHKVHREAYDVATCRALGNLSVALELCAAFVRIGGNILAIKGERASEEIEAAKQAMHLLHCAVADTQRTPTGTIVVIEKLRRTPRTYPRRPGEPKRVPLGEKTPKRRNAETPGGKTPKRRNAETPKGGE